MSESDETEDRPWEAWRERARATSPTNERLRAMRRAGLRAISRTDIGKPGHYVGTRITFACGCERMYRADLKVAAESEHVRPCESHGNLLTGLGLSLHTVPVGGKGRQQQETHDDDLWGDDH